jgi:acetylornithine/succinyldiaminopimelate/putrescine aminotransferase
LEERHRISGTVLIAVAEVIVEPIMSSVGVAVPPDECLPEVESLCRKPPSLRLLVEPVPRQEGGHGQLC